VEVGVNAILTSEVNLMTPTQLVEEALKLAPQDRADMAHRLLASLDGLSEPELEALWLAEAERRDHALDTGELKSRPAEEVFADIRSRLR
jgi:putative addiction module component (TIGR02574 family)